MKKGKVLSVGLAIISLITLLKISGCGSGDTNPSPITHKAVVVNKVTLTADEISQLPSGFVEKASELGWKQISDGFERTGPASGVEISNGTNNITTDADGFFSLPEGASEMGWAIVEGNVRLPLTKSSSRVAQRVDDQFIPVMVIESPFYSCCRDDRTTSTHDHTESQRSASATAAPMDERCLDYNGFFTDGKNYPKANWRAYRNFVGSDCDMAFFKAKCWLDHAKGGCAKAHKGSICSKNIGHSSSYHTHK